MLGSTPGKAAREDIAIKDVAELLLEGVRKAKGLTTPTIDTQPTTPAETKPTPEPIPPTKPEPQPAVATITPAPKTLASTAPEPTPTSTPERKKWQPKSATPAAEKIPEPLYPKTSLRPKSKSPSRPSRHRPPGLLNAKSGNPKSQIELFSYLVE